MCIDLDLKKVVKILNDLQECISKINALEDVSGYKIEKLTELFKNKQIIVYK